MTISLSENTPRISYSVNEGASQTAFTVPFEFYAEADLNFYVDGTKKTIATHYTVSGGDGTTGTINTTSGNTVTGISGGSTVVITRSIALARTTDFPASGPFAISTLNTELDKFIAIQADNDDTIDRALHLADDDTAVSMELPLVASRKGTVLGFNASTGAAEVGPTIANVNSLSAITANINTTAGIAANVTTVAGIAANVTTVAGVASNVTAVAGAISNVNALAASAVIADMALLATTDVIADMALLATSDVIADMNTLATSAIVADLNILATTDIVADMALLATSDIVSDLNTLATSDIVTDLNVLATSDIVADMALLATTDVVSDLNTLATTDIVSDINALAVTDIVADINLLATNAVIADMAELAGSGANPNITSLTASGEIAAASLDISGNIDVDGVTNLDVVDIDGAVDMASTLQVDGRIISDKQLTIAAADGAEDNNYIAFFKNLEATAGRSYGVNIQAGSNASDQALIVNNYAGTELFKIKGDGAVDMASTLQVDGAITSSAGATITTADNTAQLTVVSTDADAGSGPQLHFYRNSASPADGDGTGLIKFIGKNDAGQDVDYVTIDTWPNDVSDGTEDGEYNIRTMVAGSSINRMQITRTETVFNQGGSGSVDFRVESGNNENMLVVNAGDDQVIIGGDTQKTTVWQSDARGLTVVGAKPTIALHDQDNANYVSFISQVSGDQYIYNEAGGNVYFGNASSAGGNGATYMQVNNSGAVTKPLQPAFSVVNSSAQNNIAINSQVVTVFGTEIFDQNSDFSSNTFTAPVTGRYQLNAHMRIDAVDSAAYYYEMSFQTSNRSYGNIFDPDFGQDAGFWTPTLSVLADMDANDTVTLELRHENGTQQTDIVTAYFSGYLVA